MKQRVLPFLARWDKVDCMHWFANNRCVLGLVPSVVTVHDFKFIDRPGEVSFGKGLYLRRWRALRASVPWSSHRYLRATAEAAIRLFGVRSKAIFVVPNPMEDLFSPSLLEEVIELRERFKLPSHFPVYVAHPYLHKNHERLFAAYKQFRETSQYAWPLVLRRQNEGKWNT